MVATDTPRDPCTQASDIRPLAEELLDSTRESDSAPVAHQVRDELSLLVKVLASTEARCSPKDGESASSELSRTLERCRDVLKELKEAQEPSDESEDGSQHHIAEIRSRLGSLTFDLNLINANAAIFSQNKLNKAVRGFIDEIREGKRDATTVSKALDSTLPDTEKDDAWQGLQKELEQFDLEPEISTRDHDFIITTLEKAAKEEDLLKSLQEEPFSDKEITLGSPTQPFEIPLPGTGPSDTDKIAVPHSLSDLPIPTSTDLEGTSDFEKQVLHNERLQREERLLLSATYCPGDDGDKEAFFPETFPVPYTAEPESSDTYTSTQSRSDGSSASVHYSTTKLRMSRGKKPSIVKKMKFKLTTSKEEFIRLVQAGGLYTVKNALDSGAEVDTVNSQGLTALMVAVSCRHEQVADLLLEYGADPLRRTAWGDTALSLAAAKGYEEIVRTLLTHGSSVDGYGAVSKGKTAMSQAAEGGHENIVRLLFNAGANINGISHTGDTALSQAAQNGHIDVVRYLLDNGALVDHVGYPRRTALYKAVERDHLDVIKLLLERGADVDCAESIQGMTPSLLTAIHNKDEIADIMRQKQYRPALQQQGRAYTAPHRFRYH